MSVAMIIGVAGLAGSGKSIFSEVAASEFAFTLIRPGVAIKQWLEENNLSSTPENERRAQVELRKHRGSMSALVDIIMEEIKAKVFAGEKLIIDSMCSFDEIKPLQEIKGSNLVTVALHAPMASRIKWIGERKARPYNRSQLQMRDDLEIDTLQKGRMLAFADHHIANDGSISRLRTQTHRLLSALTVKLQES